MYYGEDSLVNGYLKYKLGGINLAQLLNGTRLSLKMLAEKFSRFDCFRGAPVEQKSCQRRPLSLHTGRRRDGNRFCSRMRAPDLI